jgi:hypothetical protein
MMRWVYLGREGEAYPAVRGVDTATHPDFQRRGIFSALTLHAAGELRREGCAFVFNTPNQNSLPGYLKLGWKIVARWGVYVRPIRPFRTALRLLNSYRQPREAGNLDTVGLLEWKEFRALFGDEVGRLVSSFEEQRKRVGYRTRRDLAYLDWRYGSHPNVRYGVYYSSPAAGTVDAFVIARPARGIRGLTTVAVTEMFVRDPSPASIRQFLRSFIRSVDCDYLTAYFAEGTNERIAVARLGFVAAPGRGYTWTTLPLNPVEDDPTAADQWDLTLGELEIF